MAGWRKLVAVLQATFYKRHRPEGRVATKFGSLVSAADGFGLVARLQ